MTSFAPEVYQGMGLRTSEYQLICELLGRSPTYSELGMFAVMWSEHCGYKYSRKVLTAFKKYKEASEGDGLENAGIVPIGGGLGVTFKIESHNHPSAVEPYQGAATGVGGILRDIFTMGARPIASLNSLRFGPISGSTTPEPIKARNRYLLEHVVAGIAGYGNCVGVPTVGGEVSFHPSYSGNPLVNAMSVGLVKISEVTTAAATGPGNPVIYLGSATGLDGIHGATFASVDLDEESESKRPNVQIGDPFAEKSLIEATLEALKTGAIVAIQDMGAAGITCSTVEMAAKGKVGMKVNLDLVPMREPDMEAHELLLSESQERMLCVAKLGREDEVLDVCKKWGISAAVVGYVTEEPRLVISRKGVVEVDLDPALLADMCPFYETVTAESAEVGEARSWNGGLDHVDCHKLLIQLLGSAELGSRKWVYRQFDSQVQTQTLLGPGAGDAAVLMPRGISSGVAVAVDGNGRQVWLDPFTGGVNTVAEAARNVACTGAKPVACTDGLNFGNPENPHVYHQFKEAVEGIAFACERLNTPVVSGNVSFYNRSDFGEIIPTPIIGMVGVLEDGTAALPSSPKKPDGLKLGCIQVPLETDLSWLGGSFAVSFELGQELGTPIRADLNGEARLHGLLNQLALEKRILSAHDLSEGGMATACAEIAIKANCGLHLSVSSEFWKAKSEAEALFGELPGVVFVSYEASQVDDIKRLCDDQGLPFQEWGSFFGTELVIDWNKNTWRWDISRLSQTFDSCLDFDQMLS